MDTREKSEIRDLSASEAEIVSGGSLIDLVLTVIEATKEAAQATGSPPTMDEAREYLKGKSRPA
jgi:hypothetical protein